MKTILLVIFSFVVFTTQQTTIDPNFASALKANQTACSQENGVELSEAYKIWKTPSYPASNHALKCYYNCMCQKLGIIDNGKYDNADALLAFGHFDTPQEIKEIGDECSNLPAQTDECELAYQIYKCIAETQLD